MSREAILFAMSKLFFLSTELIILKRSNEKLFLTEK